MTSKAYFQELGATASCVRRAVDARKNFASGDNDESENDERDLLSDSDRLPAQKKKACYFGDSWFGSVSSA